LSKRRRCRKRSTSYPGHGAGRMFDKPPP